MPPFGFPLFIAHELTSPICLSIMTRTIHTSMISLHFHALAITRLPDTSSLPLQSLPAISQPPPRAASHQTLFWLHSHLAYLSSSH
jgi:hypothetical protein